MRKSFTFPELILIIVFTGAILAMVIPTSIRLRATINCMELGLKRDYCEENYVKYQQRKELGPQKENFATYEDFNRYQGTTAP